MKRINTLKIITIALGILFLIFYLRLPNYREYSSFSFSDSNGRDTTMNVITYKSHYAPSLYKAIASKHNKINGTPRKLTINLFFFKRTMHNGGSPYRTVVFDYENQLEYIFLDSINDAQLYDW